MQRRRNLKGLKFKNGTIIGYFGSVFEEDMLWAGNKITCDGYGNIIVFEELLFQNVFVHTKTQSRRFQTYQV